MTEAIDPDGQPAPERACGPEPELQRQQQSQTRAQSAQSRETTTPRSKSSRHYSEIALWKDVTPEQWSDWKWQLKNSVRTLEQLEQVINLTADERDGFLATRSEFAMAITPYLCTLMDPEDPSCPVRMQFAPRLAEIGGLGVTDSLGEDAHRVAPGLVHRYPDRVLFLVNNMCASYCRFCTRKRLTGLDNEVLPKAEIEQALAYLRAHTEVRDVLISGGDPLTMSDKNLEYVVARLREIPSIEIVRIGTKMPMFLPMRVTDELVKMLSKYHPLWINTHFNHPKEMTPEAKAACARIVNAGIPLGNQTVLLRGVNSSARIMKDLMQELVKNRVRPYYIYQCDLEDGLEHFRTPVETGIEIMEALRGWTTGFAVPTFVIDAPGGGGKIPVAPNYLMTLGESRVMIRNFEGEAFSYPQPRERDCTVRYESKWYGEDRPVETPQFGPISNPGSNPASNLGAGAAAKGPRLRTKLRVLRGSA